MHPITVHRNLGPNSFAKVFQRLRLEANLSEKGLAAVLQMSPEIIDEIEWGRHIPNCDAFYYQLFDVEGFGQEGVKQLFNAEDMLRWTWADPTNVHARPGLNPAGQPTAAINLRLENSNGVTLTEEEIRRLHKELSTVTILNQWATS